jgi:hypothetical protein
LVFVILYESRRLKETNRGTFSLPCSRKWWPIPSTITACMCR